MSIKNSTWFDQAVVRLPLMAYNIALKQVRDSQSLKAAYQNSYLKEAIFIASPQLYEEMQNWLNGPNITNEETLKLETTLLKYLLRSAFRCTPFGLFAGCSIVELSQKSSLIVNPVKDFTRDYKIDLELLHNVIEKIGENNDVKNVIKYFPNNTIYRIGNILKYIRTIQNGEFETAQIANNEITKLILEECIHGKTINELVEKLFYTGIEKSYLVELICNLIALNILQSEMMLTVTGENNFNRLLKVFQEKHPSAISILLSTINGEISKLKNDSNDFQTNLGIYKTVFSLFEKFEIKVNPQRTFHLDTFVSLAENTIDKNIAKTVLQALEITNYLNRGMEQAHLAKFKTEFKKRYEDQEVSLAQVFDIETGLTYPITKETLGNISLIDNLHNQRKTEKIELSNTDLLLANLCADSISQHSYVLKLDKSILPDFALSVDEKPLPPTFSALISVSPSQIRTNTDNLIELIAAGGPSANPMIARFGVGNRDIANLCGSIADYEQMKVSDGGVIAEVVHIPAARACNVIQRPILSKFEIPFYGQSSLGKSEQINISDILISVSGNTIILRSKIDGRRIYPQFSSAQNYSASRLSVHHFLCDLQYDNRTYSFTFRWNRLLEIFKFLPRVQYKNVVLKPACWNLSKSDYEEILSASDSLLDEAFLKWRNKHRMPRFIAIAEDENELVIDSESPLCQQLLRSEMKKRTQILIQEKIFNTEKSISQRGEELFLNEILIAYKTSNNSIISAPSAISPIIDERRTFLPFEDCLYYKIYCNSESANSIIAGIKNLCDHIIKAGLATKFFFIRYGDPRFHIRLRFFSDNKNDLYKIHDKVMNGFKIMSTNKKVTDITIDTYNRELERYNPLIINEIESIFFNDSVMAFDFASFGENKNNEWLFAMFSIDRLLSDFSLDLYEKGEILNSLSRIYMLDGVKNLDKNIKNKIGQKYSLHKPKIHELLGGKYNNQKPFEFYYKIALKRTKANDLVIVNILDKISREDLLNDILLSVIHMTSNRILSQSQSVQEIYIYEMLRRYYSEMKFTQANSDCLSAN